MRIHKSWLIVLALSSASALSATSELLQDVGDEAVIAGSSPEVLGSAGGRAYLAATPFNGVPRLYRTDGTSAGTAAVVTVDVLANPRQAMEVGSGLLFLGSRPTGSGNDLWITNGTDAGTVRIRTLGTHDGNLHWFGVSAGRGYFCYVDQFLNCDLFVTDGTVGGTERLVTQQRVELGASWLLDDGSLYFFMSNGAQISLWASDGTVASTRQLVSLLSTTVQNPRALLRLQGGAALLTGTDAQGLAIFSVDVASGATTRLQSLPYDTRSAGVDLGSVHLFIQGNDLWRSDGTVGGTYVLTHSNQLNGIEGPICVIGGRAVFRGNDAASGSELWATDGTLAGTVLLADAAPGVGGSAKILTCTPHRAFFLGGEFGSGVTRFWVSDGTPAGTHVIPLAGDTSYSLSIYSQQSGVVAGDRLYFNISDLRTIPNGFQEYFRLFTTDLTGSNVTEAGVGGPGRPLGNRFVYANTADVAGSEPWVSDGTSAGTSRLIDISVSGQTASGDPREFTTLGSRVFFTAVKSESGRELWVTDGTGAGTRLFRDLVPGPYSGTPYGLQVIGDYLYFRARTGVSTQDLWRTDGTDAGTFPLNAPLSLASNSNEGDCTVPWGAAMGGRAWFFSDSENNQGYHLWSSDGTSAGTRMEFQLPASIRSQGACGLRTVANGMVFIVRRVGDEELWRTDGTLSGTYRLGTLRPATTASFGARGNLVVSGGIAYLLADGGSGYEPWRTDGTQAGTRIVGDLTAGVGGAHNFRATPLGEGIVFSYGSEEGTADGLWRVATAASGATLIKSGWTGTGHLPLGVGSQVFFDFNLADTTSLWVTDGTAAGTRELFNHGVGSTLLINRYMAGNGVLFYDGPESGGFNLWYTNGIPGAQRAFGRFNNFGAHAGDHALLQGKPVYALYDPTSGYEPWIVRGAAPVATPDAATVTAGSNVLVNVRSNDTDADSAAVDLVASIVTAPLHGTAVLEGGSVRYTPTAGYSGADSLQYRIADELGSQSAPVTVSITVNAVSNGGGSGSSGGGNSGGGRGGGGALAPSWLALLLFLIARRRPR